MSKFLDEFGWKIHQILENSLKQILNEAPRYNIDSFIVIVGRTLFFLLERHVKTINMSVGSIIYIDTWRVNANIELGSMFFMTCLGIGDETDASSTWIKKTLTWMLTRSFAHTQIKTKQIKTQANCNQFAKNIVCGLIFCVLLSCLLLFVTLYHYYNSLNLFTCWIVLS